MMAERHIDPAIIREALFSPDAEVIEDYPNHPGGSACLILGWWGNRCPLHVVFGVGSRLYIVTVYDPSVNSRHRWESPDFRTRRRSG
jgi:hypothetical protein